MILSKKIDEMLKEITKKSIEYNNTKGTDRNYIKKLVHIYDTSLSQDERIFLASYIFNNLHFKNLVIDEDNMLKATNIKLRTIFFIFLLAIIFLVIAAMLFKTNDTLNNIVSNIFTMIDLLNKLPN